MVESGNLTAAQQETFSKLIQQLKEGCVKEFCFNKHCAKNYIDPVWKKFRNESDYEIHARQTILNQQGDHEELICSDVETINRSKLRSANAESLNMLLYDCAAFCCSFQEQGNANGVMGNTGAGAFKKTFSQESAMEVDEVSAFMLDWAEPTDELQGVQVDELHKLRSEMLAERDEMIEKYAPLNLDSSAIKYFFKHLRMSSGDEESFWQQIETTVEIIITEFDNSDDDPYKQLMCIRGLIILILNEQVARDRGQEAGTRILQTMNNTLGKAVSQESRKNKQLSQHPIVVQFLSVMPKKMMHELVMQLQNIMTHNIIQGHINAKLFEENVKMLDTLHWVNFTFKDTKDHIDKKEFTNDAVNSDLDLRALMDQWANRTKVQVRNGVQITHANQFNPCSYYWLFTPHTKTLMLQRYNKIDWKFQADYFLMRAFWDPEMRKNKFRNAQKFLLEVSRENILDDSLQKIVHLKSVDGHDPLKMQLSCRFSNEPGIDEGGVRKEYFSLVIKELLSPGYAMFKFNEDVQLYYFNGQTLEPNIYFELIGNLMGIAIYNNTFIDLPFPRACYKVLIDQEPDLDDLRQWEPETATSLEAMLSWDDQKMGGSMEDVLCRTFTADVQQFGAISSVELKEGGANIPVSKANVKEFVRLYIEFQFQKQCEGQLASFKKGFARVIDMLVVKSLFGYEEVEALICGQRELNFAELRDCAIYAEGYRLDQPMMKWLWEIVLEEWEDDKRRQLLRFSTGSDRAPINGLKSLKFYVIKDGQDDQRLPSSHTCFNQLLIPQYSRKEILRERLQTAVENATGFGMV